MTRVGTIASNDRPLLGAIVLLAASLSIGGGGSSHRLAELVIEMTAVLVAAITFALPLQKNLSHYGLFRSYFCACGRS